MLLKGGKETANTVCWTVVFSDIPTDVPRLQTVVLEHHPSCQPDHLSSVHLQSWNA